MKGGNLMSDSKPMSKRWLLQTHMMLPNGVLLFLLIFAIVGVTSLIDKSISPVVASTWNLDPDTVSSAQASEMEVNLYTMSAEEICSPTSGGTVITEGVHRQGKSQFVLCYHVTFVTQYVQYGERGAPVATRITEDYKQITSIADRGKLSSPLQHACADQGEVIAVSNYVMAPMGEAEHNADRNLARNILTSDQAWCKNGNTTTLMVSAGLSSTMAGWRVKHTWVATPPNIY